VKVVDAIARILKIEGAEFLSAGVSNLSEIRAEA